MIPTSFDINREGCSLTISSTEQPFEGIDSFTIAWACDESARRLGWISRLQNGSDPAEVANGRTAVVPLLEDGGGMEGWDDWNRSSCKGFVEVGSSPLEDSPFSGERPKGGVTEGDDDIGLALLNFCGERSNAVNNWA